MTVKNIDQSAAPKIQNFKELQCSQCGNGGVVKASAVYEAGTFSNRSTSVGFIVGDGEMIPTISRNRGTGESLLAQKLQPPKYSRNSLNVMYLSFLALAGFIIYVVADGNGPVTLIIIGSLAFYARHIYLNFADNIRKDRSDREKYNRTWYCPRCGYIGDETSFGVN